jgi:hypothetical protein
MKQKHLISSIVFAMLMINNTDAYKLRMKTKLHLGVRMIGEGIEEPAGSDVIPDSPDVQKSKDAVSDFS